MTGRNSNAGGGSGSWIPDSTSTSLLERVKAHRPEAWQRLAEFYSPVVYSWCRHCSVPPQDAADVLQDVFWAVHLGIANFRRQGPSDSFRGWLWTITRNKIRDHFRARAKQPEAKGGTDAQLQLLQLPQAEPDARDDSTGSCKAPSLFLAGLELIRLEFEERTWQAFWQAAVQGQPTAHIAADLDMSVNAVRKAKSRVLRRLRQEFRGLID